MRFSIFILAYSDHWRFADTFTVVLLQNELKTSKANTEATPANLSESEFPEF
jgi:hypothetical protein